MRKAVAWAAPLAMFVSAPSLGQTPHVPVIAAPAEPGAIPLGTGGVTGVQAPESWFMLGGQRTVRNVVTATLTPVLPASGRATGAAVIVAPGGGFIMLSMDNEGWPVARWLADHGVAAFVLKYRLTPTPPDLLGFFRQMSVTTGASMRPGPQRDIVAPPEALADAQAALALVRRRAAEWHIDPQRLGIMGFSAGAITALSVARSATPETMPGFIAPIYGPLAAIDVPANAPPMFNALAADDPLFSHHGFALIDAWQQAHRPVEFHLFANGSHGFGMGRPNTATNNWLDVFYHWLDTSGFLRRSS